MRLYRKLGCLISVLALMAGCSSGPYVSHSPAPASERAAAPSSASSEKLGTQWGEGVASEVTTVDLKRVSKQPVDLVEVRYSSVNNPGRAVQEVLLAKGRIGLSIIGDNNRKWKLTQNGRDLYLQGKKGERYQLSYRNNSQNTYEIVATVDGLDVLRGSSGSISNRGYVLYPNSTLVIEGFRKSQHEVATFRFAAVEDSYAANTKAGSPDNVGIIGTAVFELFDPNAPKPSGHGSPRAFPADQPAGDYAPPPNYRR